MMSAPTTWTIGSVELPYSPNQISEEVDCQTDSLELDGVAAILFATAPGIRVLTISGSIAENGSDKADLETDYIADLRAMQGTEQTVASPSGAYDGDWLVKKVSFREQAEGSIVARILYTIVLWQGSDLVVL
jgi:hypothetical protein